MNFARVLSAWALLLLLGSCSHARETSFSDSATLAGHPAPRVPQVPAPATVERLTSSDTVSLHYKKLQQFLPAELAGFVPDGEPRGEFVSLGGVSYSTCEQRYRRGGQQLKVLLVDYNGAKPLYASATALMGNSISQEDDVQLMQGCDLGLPGVLGYETLQKKEHRALVALGVGNRFFVSVESTRQQNTQLVKYVAQLLDLKRLAAL
jgi:hypothetical protein